MAYLIAKFCMFPWNHGLGKLHSDTTIDTTSILLNKIFGNLEYLSESLTRK
jgi:hypothetical protein